MNKFVIIILVVVMLSAVLSVVVLGIGTYYWNNGGLWEKDVIEKIEFQIPDTDMTVELRCTTWLSHRQNDIYYVKERYFLPDKETNLGSVSDFPIPYDFSFERDSNYSVVNNGDGTFTFKYNYGEKNYEKIFNIPSDE